MPASTGLTGGTTLEAAVSGTAGSKTGCAGAAAGGYGMPQGARGATGGSAPRTTRPQRPVLVVEDDPDFRDLLEIFLRWDGFVVCTAADGLEAFKCLEAHRPCIILLDVSMPRMDGITFGRTLRRHPDPQLAHTPIVLLTALIDPTDAVRATDAVEVMSKPLALEQVVDVIERHCGS